METLTDLALKHGTDKFGGGHSYTCIYEMYLDPIRDKEIRLLEIGYGGYENPDCGGESARMWADYFKNGKIIVTDIYPKNLKPGDRFTFKQGSQTDEKFMTSLGRFSICLDDGSHISKDMIASFEIMFPLLEDGGIYIIEDVQTSYFKEYNHEGLPTTMGYFKGLTDGLNHAEIRDRPNYVPTYFERNIFSIHYYHNLIIIMKGENMEPSNIVRNNWNK